MSSMQEYLAAKYMSGAKADAILARAEDKTLKRKKRKVKTHADSLTSSVYDDAPSASGSGAGGGEGGGLMLVDEDGGGGWGNVDDEAKEDDAPTVETKSGEFKSSTKSNWARVHTGTTPPPADDIPLSGPSTSSSSEHPPPASPTDNEPPAAAPLRKGGLRSAAQMREEEARLAALEARDSAARSAANASEEAEAARLAQETVYRDSSGKKLDMKSVRAEERRLKREQDEKEAAKMEWGKGVVQRGEKEARARKEKEEAGRDLARYANDADMNRELKEVSRWNDPAANFLTTKKAAAPRLPTYDGPWAPNRFNIPPGCRWDGVERGTGFEAKYFQNINSKKRRQLEGYAYGAEDM